MNIRIIRGLAATTLLLLSLPAIAQNIRYEWGGEAAVTAEDRQIAERFVDLVVGASPGVGSQVVFFRGNDRVPGDLDLNDHEGSLAQLPSGAYYAIAVAPGSHTYSVDGQTLAVQVAPGERSYVRIGDYRANPELSASTALTFLRLVTGKREPLYASN